MRCPRGNGLVRTCVEVPHRAGWCVARFELEVDRTVLYQEPTPPAFRGAVGAEQVAGHGILVPRAGSAEDRQALGELGSVAEGTLDVRTDVRDAPGGIEHPRSLLERRAVANVLAVVAGQLRHPVSVAVGVEADDGADHRPLILVTARSPLWQSTRCSMVPGRLDVALGSTATSSRRSSGDTRPLD